jgi:hypothetical protein
MTFSRANPSPRYVALVGMYRDLHENGERNLGLPPDHTFNGMSLMPQMTRIKALIERTGSRSVLDYGSGKGQQYAPMELTDETGEKYDGVIDYWGVDSVHCYDPSFRPYSNLPRGRFDGVVSTDVLEHCPEEDIPWIVEEIFGFAERCVYANIACYPAKKHLPSGENAHCTIKPLGWWDDILRSAAARRPGIVWEAWVQSVIVTQQGPSLHEEVVRGG